MKYTRRRWRRAIFHSLAVTTFFVLAVEVAFLPRQLGRLLQSTVINVVDCQTCDAGRVIVLLMKTNPAVKPGLHKQLVVYDPSGHPRTKGRLADLAQPRCFVASPDAQSLFVADAADRSIHWIHGRGFSRSRCVGRHSQGVPHTLALTSDRSTLVSLGDREIYAWDVSKWRLRWCRRDQDPSSIVILPDAQTMVCSSSERKDGRLEEIDVATGKTLQILVEAGPEVRTLVASHDGRFVAGIKGDHGLFLLERNQDGTVWHERTSPAQPDVLARAVPAFSPQSNRLVLGCRDGRTLLVWNLRHPITVHEVRLPSEYKLIGHLFLDEDTLLSWTQEGDLHRWRLPEQLKM